MLEHKIIGISDDGLLLGADGTIYQLVEGNMNGYFSADGYYNAKGRLKKLGKFIKKGIDKVGDTKVGKVIRKGRDAAIKVVKKAGLAVPRNAFLVLVRINARGFASEYNDWKLNNKPKYDKLLSTWYSKLGGEKRALERAIEAGKNKPILFNKARKAKFKKADGTEEIVYFNAAGTIAASIAAAAPVIAVIAQIVGKPKAMDDEELSEISDASENSPIDASESGESFLSKYKWYLIGGGVVLLGGLAFFLLKPKTQSTN